MMFRWNQKILSIVVLFGLLACGQGSSSLRYGTFKDSNVEGISFSDESSIGGSGITGAQGRFSYVPGGEVTFSLGAVVLGKAEAKPIVTPLDLIYQGSTDSESVLNIVRFLMFLDQDNDASNGIVISNEIRDRAADWRPVDFHLPLTVEAHPEIFFDVRQILGRDRVVPERMVAKRHFEETLRCIHSGAFRGVFEGGNRGTFGVWVDSKSRQVLGAIHSTLTNETSSLEGLSPVSYDYAMSFSSGTVNTGATFEGNFDGSDQIFGTWENRGRGRDYDGDFSGERIGGSIDAIFRFTGQYVTDDGLQKGLFSLDVDEKNHVQGIAYNVTFDVVFDVEGELSGNDFTATISDGSRVSGTMNTKTGQFHVSFINEDTNVLGYVEGSGCKLN